MSPEQQETLTLYGKLPARLFAEQAAHILNFRTHDIPILVAAKLLKPLGMPPPSGVKYFARADIVKLGEDVTWLSRATKAIYEHWDRENRRRENGAEARSPARNGSKDISRHQFFHAEDQAHSQR